MNPNPPSRPHSAERARFVGDPHRPRYHFLPPANWMNDPNGLIQWQGLYHLFYQYNPVRAAHGNIHWGHAVSRDLVHWDHWPIALAPTPVGPDADGCWSGCAVDDGGVPTILYTGLAQNRQLPCLAVSHDDLQTLEKWPGNPIIAGPPAGLDVLGFRDHSVWHEGDLWYQVIGSGIRDVGGAALLYRSPDLRRWEYLHPLCVGDVRQREPIWTGPMWECPNFFPLGDRHVLLISVCEAAPLYTAYLVGTYADHRFTPEVARKMDYGDQLFYAPQTLLDDGGRRLAWGWIYEARSVDAQLAAGWSGMMSLPRVLTLRPDGWLGQAPVPELAMLRRNHIKLPGGTVAGTPALLPAVQGDSLELIAELEPGDAAQVGLRVRCAPDGAEETHIYYEVATGRLVYDGARSSQDPTVEASVLSGPLDLQPGEPLHLHVFLDRSVVEVFANGRACLTGRVYPARLDSFGVGLLAVGGSATVLSFDAWTMDTIWPGDAGAIDASPG